MIATLILILGGVAVIEGLVLALAPLRFEELLRALAEIDPGVRRQIGLGIVALGVVLVWIARSMGA